MKYEKLLKERKELIQKVIGARKALPNFPEEDEGITPSEKYERLKKTIEVLKKILGD